MLQQLPVPRRPFQSPGCSSTQAQGSLHLVPLLMTLYQLQAEKVAFQVVQSLILQLYRRYTYIRYVTSKMLAGYDCKRLLKYMLWLS